jgi:hypothetical protein
MAGSNLSAPAVIRGYTHMTPQNGHSLRAAAVVVARIRQIPR